MSARRWPIITFALIAINLAAFLATNSTIQEQSAAMGRTKAHILMLIGLHPELQMTPEVQAFVDDVKKSQPGLWREAQDANRPIVDEWDARMRMIDGTTDIYQAEMDQLAAQYSELAAGSLTERYAFAPGHPKPVTYLTANFLHGGWLHLIGNMWFLWLAGFLLEDIWGRPVYAVFYLLAGAAALQFHAWLSGSMLVPTLGASGAVAALMGAFLVRFPTTKINMGFFYILFFRPRFYRFQMRAYWLLPLWLLMEVVYGMWFGQMTGVAHWAHVGGFLFGAVVALGIKFSGLE
ncbi:MAG: rhomboid family intramembrane serine protease, partial [Acidobacteriota bacterium]